MKIFKDFIQKCRRKIKTKKEKELLQSIVRYQTKLYPVSIFDKSLLFPYFDDEIIENVTEQLGYNYISYPEKQNRSVIIIFSPKK